MTALLEVSDLCVDFGRHRVPAVKHVSFSIDAGSRFGLIGESGSGKSVTALAIMGLLPENAHVSGSIRFRGRELLGLSDADMSRLRGDDIGMIFQEPMTALDPTMTAGRQVAEVLRLHDSQSPNARQRVLDILDAVGLADPPRVARSFPHTLSGGQRQRVLLAMALINTPDLVICDEPTTALDVTVQARVLELLDRRLAEAQAACLFISHDLAVVSRVSQQLMVMRDGEVVETGSVGQVLGNPQHGYTAGLVATARVDQVAPGERLPVVSDFEDAQ